MARARIPVNPYASRVPKPRVVHLIGLLTCRQRANYRTLARALKRLPGVHGELYHHGESWGWTLRYRRGDATLCTMHFLPSRLDSTITITRGLEEWAMGPNHLSPVSKKDIAALRRCGHPKMLRMPLGSRRRTLDLLRMVRYKAQKQRGAGGA